MKSIHPKHVAERLVLAAVLLAGLGWGHSAFASTQFLQTQTNEYRIAKGESNSNEVWVLAKSVRIDGAAEDELFLAGLGEGLTGPGDNVGGVVSLSGLMKDDVWAFGNAITNTGTIEGHARLVSSQTIQMNGTVGKSLIALGSVVNLSGPAAVGRDAYLIGKDVFVGGSVTGNVWVSAQRITLSGWVGGNVRLAGDDVVVMPGTEIDGNLAYVSGSELVLDPAVKLKGKLSRLPVAAPEAKARGIGSLFFQMALYVGALLVGLVFVFLFPELVGTSVQQVQFAHWKCLLAGYLVFCIIPIAAVVALFTGVGIPLGFVLLLLYAVLLYVSKFITAIVVGHLILRRGRTAPIPVFSALSLGLVLLYALVNVDFIIGVIVWCAITFLGLGGLTMSLLARRSAYRHFMRTNVPPPPGAGAETNPVPPPAP